MDLSMSYLLNRGLDSVPATGVQVRLEAQSTTSTYLSNLLYANADLVNAAQLSVYWLSLSHLVHNAAYIVDQLEREPFGGGLQEALQRPSPRLYVVPGFRGYNSPRTNACVPRAEIARSYRTHHNAARCDGVSIICGSRSNGS